MLLAKEEMLLQSVIDIVIEIGRGHGTEMNVELPPIQIMIDQKQLGSAIIFQLFW